MSQSAIHGDAPSQPRHGRPPSRTHRPARPASADSGRSGSEPLAPLDIWARAAWSRGMCVRCNRTGVEVTPVGRLPTLNAMVQICLCRACVFQIEQAHWATVLDGDGVPGAPDSDGFTWWGL